MAPNSSDRGQVNPCLKGRSKKVLGLGPRYLRPKLRLKTKYPRFNGLNGQWFKNKIVDSWGRKKEQHYKKYEDYRKNLIQRAIHIDRKVVSISDPVIYEQLGLSVFTIEWSHLIIIIIFCGKHILFADGIESTRADPNGILRNFPLKSEMRILSQKAKSRNGVSQPIAIISC